MGNSGLSDTYYVSKRFEEAVNEGKLTAGEAAKIISKALNRKILAKDVITLYEIVFYQTPEWHHSGFFKPKNGGRSKMGKTYFFTLEEINEMVEKFPEIEENFKKKKEYEEEVIYAIYWEWTPYYGGPYGKKMWGKELRTFHGRRKDLKVPRDRVIECDEAHFLKAKEKEDEEFMYTGWDAPKLEDFE